jgi:DNA mismatch endonuclease (patch repair protein)
MVSPRAAASAAPSDTSPGRRRNMQAIRRRDTGPERALRSALHASGYRYRCDLRIDLAGARVRPDIVFTRRKVAVFVDGCFWHCCPEHGRQPAVNSGYWSPKLQGNRDRDRRNTEALEQAGWVVVRVWEHEPVAEAMGKVIAALSGR